MDALPIARARGQVMQFVQDGECLAEFVISGNGKVIFVRIRRAVPFLCTPAEFEAEFRELILQLRRIPGYGPVVLEFWVYSKKGSWRFFRVEDAGLVEIGRDGLPLPLKGKVDPMVKGMAGGKTIPAGISSDPPSPTEKTPVFGMVENKPSQGSV
jgi:hypothetical protein